MGKLDSSFLNRLPCDFIFSVIVFKLPPGAGSASCKDGRWQGQQAVSEIQNKVAEVSKNKVIALCSVFHCFIFTSHKVAECVHSVIGCFKQKRAALFKMYF